MRIHRALHKPTGRHLTYYNPEHQSANDRVLRSCELGGIEWNWSPGMIGHTVFSENPVYVARLRTAKGDALRIYEREAIKEHISRLKTSITSPIAQSCLGIAAVTLNRLAKREAEEWRQQHRA